MENPEDAALNSSIGFFQRVENDSKRSSIGCVRSAESKTRRRIYLSASQKSDDVDNFETLIFTKRVPVKEGSTKNATRSRFKSRTSKYQIKSQQKVEDQGQDESSKTY